MTSIVTNTSNGGLDRKSLKKPDQFTETTGRFFDDVRKHNKLFLTLILALLAFGAAMTYFLNRKDEASNVAKDALFDARLTMETEMKALAPAKTEGATDKAAAADAEAVLFRKLDVDAKLPQTVRKLQTVEKEHSGSRVGFDARMILGDLYFQHGETAKSQTWFQKAVDTAPNSTEKAFALKGLGYSLENQGKNSEAAQTFEKALAQGEAGLIGELMMSAARNYELAHDAAKARSTYDQIISKLPETDYAKSAEHLKAKLQ